MDSRQKENYRREIVGRLEMLERNLNEFKRKAARQPKGAPGFGKHLASIELQKKAIEEKLRDLDRSDQDGWDKFRNDMEGFFSDMDKSMREALAHYK